MLAYAGLKRLGKSDVVTNLMDPEELSAGAGPGRDLHRGAAWR
jgi:porphobilinogen deaminase